jgi:Cft2 family RNA processing exonuclease
MVAPFIFAAGAALNLGSSIYGANMAKKDLKRQAMALEDQARLVEEQGQFQAIQTAKQFDSLLGEQKVSVATSGAEMEGSVLNIFDKTIADKEQNIAIIKKNAEIEASLLRQQAMQARKKRKRLLPMAVVSSLGNIGQSASNFSNIGNKTLTQ